MKKALDKIMRMDDVRFVHILRIFLSELRLDADQRGCGRIPSGESQHHHV